MSQVEELLYAAYAQGKRDELLKRVKEIQLTPQHKWTDYSELYSLAWGELVKEGVISETTVL